MPEEKSKSNLHLIERRVEKRVLVHVPVDIAAFDGEGRPFTERTFIEDVSDLGCRFSTRVPIQQGATVTVKILGPNGKTLPDEQPQYYEIMWVAPKKQGTTVGARLLQGEKLANLKIPPKNGGPKHDTK